MSSFIDSTQVRAYGVDDIDADHADIKAIANRLFDGIQQHRAAQTLGDLLAELVDCCERHFQLEESYFRALRDAKAAAAHKADHDVLRRRLEAIRAAFAEQPAASDSLLALAVLRDYLLQHIKTFDAALAARIIRAMPGSDVGNQP